MPTNLALASITATTSTATRTFGDRFADVVNVKDFGAVGDGSDQTVAIQAAFNWNRLTTSAPTASGNTLNFTPGTIPSWVQKGMAVANGTHGNAFFGGTTVSAINLVAGTITLSANVAAGTTATGDTIIVGQIGKVYFPPGKYVVSSPGITLPQNPVGTAAVGADTPPSIIIEGCGASSNIIATTPFNGFIFDDMSTVTNRTSGGPWEISHLNITNNYVPSLIYRSNVIAAATWSYLATSIIVTNASSTGIVAGAIIFDAGVGGFDTFSQNVPGFIGVVTTVAVDTPIAGQTTWTLAAGAAIPSGASGADRIFVIQGYYANGSFSTSSPTVTMVSSNPGLDAGNYYVWDFTKVTAGTNIIPQCLGVTTAANWSATTLTLNTNSNVASTLSTNPGDLLVLTPISGAIRHSNASLATVQNCFLAGVIGITFDYANVSDLTVGTPVTIFGTVRNSLISNGVGNSAAIGVIGIYGSQGTFIENCDISGSWNAIRLMGSNTKVDGGRMEVCAYAVVLGGITHTANSNVGNGACILSNFETEGTWICAVCADTDGFKQLMMISLNINTDHQNACYGLFFGTAAPAEVTVLNCSINGNVNGSYGGFWNPSFQGPGKPAGIYIPDISSNPQYVTFISTISNSQVGSFNVTNGLTGQAWRMPTKATTAKFSNCNNPPPIYTFANLPVPLTLTGQISADGTGTGAAGTILKITAGAFTTNAIVGSVIVGSGVTSGTQIISHNITGINQNAVVNNSQTIGSETLTVYPMVDGDEYLISDGLAANCADGTCTTFGTAVTAGGGSLHLKVRWRADTQKWILV